MVMLYAIQRQSEAQALVMLILHTFKLLTHTLTKQPDCAHGFYEYRIKTFILMFADPCYIYMMVFE